MTFFRRAICCGVIFALASTSAWAAPQCWEPSAEDEFADLARSERTEHGLSNLTIDPDLSRVARTHTIEMIDAGDIYHSSRNTLEERVTNWDVLGENVGVGRTPSSLHDAFMESRKHRSNILFEDFYRIGVGAASRDGRLWVTVMFATERDPGTTTDEPEC